MEYKHRKKGAQKSQIKILCAEKLKKIHCEYVSKSLASFKKFKIGKKIL